MIYIILTLSGIFSAISEASNHSKLDWTGLTWFKQDGWRNKYTWKPIGLWRFWPLVVFTDCFHLFKTLFILSVSVAIWIGSDSWWLGFVAYSISFSVVYSIIDTINQWQQKN